MAKKIATLQHGQRQTGKFAGVLTQVEAAQLMNVSERSVRTAGKVLEDGAPEDPPPRTRQLFDHLSPNPIQFNH